jgi:dihydroorotase
MSVNPARILRVPVGRCGEGSRADVTILAPELKVRVDAQKMRSRSKNTPFDGWELRGGVAATIVGGRILYAMSRSDRSSERSDRWSVRSVRTFNSCEPLE